MPKLELYSVRDGIVPKKSGLNWGLANAHVKKEDAYIALTKSFLIQNPDFFPEHGDIIEINWDDGIKMFCLLEGTQIINGIIYPKQISSYNEKSELGRYLRQRIGVKSNQLITLSDLEKYGKTFIEASKLGTHKFFFDLHI